jgi:hypothetical protein
MLNLFNDREHLPHIFIDIIINVLCLQEAPAIIPDRSGLILMRYLTLPCVI